MPGPPKKPHHLKIVEGNPGHQKLANVPDFDGEYGPPARGLRAEGRKLWVRLARELSEKGLESSVYRTALEGLCVNYQRARDADKTLREKGLTFTSPSGYVGQRPEVSISHKSWHAVRAFCSEFGLTPAAVGRISLPKTPTKSLREQLMG